MLYIFLNFFIETITLGRIIYLGAEALRSIAR